MAGQSVKITERNPGLKAVQRSLPSREWRFAVHYVRLGGDAGHGAEAARQAGVPVPSAKVRACQYLRRPRVQAAIAAIREWCENTDEIDERLILNGLAKAALESVDAKDRIQALVALAKIRRMGAFGGASSPMQAPQVTQTVMVMQSFGVDAQSGRVSDASKFADALGRAFGADQAAAMLAQLGMQAPERVLEHADISPDAGLEVLQAIDCEPGDSVTD